MNELENNLLNGYWWLQLAIPTFSFWLLAKLSKVVLKAMKQRSIKRRDERERHISKVCSDDVLVNKEIGLRNAYYTAFMLSAVVFIYMLALKPFNDLLKVSPLISLVVGIPIFILEFMWLYKDVLVTDILRAREAIKASCEEKA